MFRKTESRTGTTKCYSPDKVGSNKRAEVDVEQDKERIVKLNKRKKTMNLSCRCHGSIWPTENKKLQHEANYWK